MIIFGTDSFGSRASSSSSLFQLVLVRLAVREPVVDVLGIRAGVGESLETFGALERLLSGVESLVLRQMVLVLEGLVAV